MIEARADPLAVTHERVSLFGAAGRVPERPLGPLRLFVCRSCGRAEWFADAPETIPIGEEHGTRLVARKPGGPYR